MTDESLSQPATKGDLQALRKGLASDLRKELSSDLRAAVRTEVSEQLRPLEGKMGKWTDEILTSNDKVIKKLDTLLTEKTATTAQLDRHEKKVGNLESFAKNVSVKTNISFQVVE